ncbi:STM4015 family protein [Nonomuraea sp. NPDC050022]|uniref:STM4015 family protein n=1 Tax=unclassified Nonomuraea TaxID=2593643 RepID=UPI0033DA7D43
MSFHQHLPSFYDLPVCDREDGEELPADAAWRVTGMSPYGESDAPSLREDLDDLLSRVDGTRIRAIVVGQWGPDYDSPADVAVEALTGVADRLPALEAVFLGDIVSEESELSWISQGDITPLLAAYPRLKRLDVRGSTGLRLQPIVHAGLEILRFECGGLPAGVVHAVGESSFPALRHLELWLGEENYSGDSGPGDWAGILAGSGLPALRHLGLQDSERQDEVAAAVAAAPIVVRLESLDLSMGVLTDEGAEALLSGQPLTHLRSLDLSHHWLSEPMMARLQAALPEVRLDLSDVQENEDDEDWRYIAVSE